ncbi:hypothetical protein [Methylogaea oryzae]|uniref:Uncharacterized protein n=1 Tax=Methylogaea oryzae TaxID=1295382 RepID=A0A8D5AJK8_9GAMM|nr:hypothetical protein [Methylogaea oryzae]BBL70904.1 hypothetical protein MoryE10_15100 [Methylogaea oryzae]
MQRLLKHPHRRKASIGLVALGGALLFLAPEAGGWFGGGVLLAGVLLEGLAVYRGKADGD